jgi:hypothetical protein
LKLFPETVIIPQIMAENEPIRNKWSPRERNDGPWFRNVQIGGVWMIEHYDGSGRYTYTEPPVHAFMPREVVDSLFDPTKYVPQAKPEEFEDSQDIQE